MSQFEYPPQAHAPLIKMLPRYLAGVLSSQLPQGVVSNPPQLQEDSSSASVHSATDKMKIFSILPALLAIGTAVATDAWSFKDASVAVVSKSAKGGLKEP